MTVLEGVRVLVVAPDSLEEARQVADALAAELGVDAVPRGAATAEEYLREFGPLTDCVVALSGDTAGLADSVTETPLVVYGEDFPESTVDSVVSPDCGVDALADQVADSVGRARKRDRLTEANAKLTALNTYTREITGCETVEEIGDEIVAAVTEALAYGRCVLGWVDGDQIVPYGDTLPNEEEHRFTVDDGLAGRTYRTGESQVVDDYQSSPLRMRDDDSIRSVVSVPIGDHGVIQITAGTVGAFDERDAEFLEIVASHAAEAFSRLQRESELRTERDRLHVFFEGLPAPTVYVEATADRDAAGGADAEETTDGGADVTGSGAGDAAVDAERNGGAACEPVVSEVNAAYEAAFGDGAVGRRVDEAFPTAVERALFGDRLDATETVTESVRRDTAEAADVELTVTLVPVRTPGVDAAAFGVYVADVTLP
ncbi:GAF domain-containing protein [Halobaculum sp. D14]|uniref:GAF domain-containing protein n=1 Tax=unclassified Halobaculum TaxID=2640896 RepID=UPI003EBB93F4